MASPEHEPQPNSNVHSPLPVEDQISNNPDEGQSGSVATNDSAGRDESPAPSKKRARRSNLADIGLRKRVRGRQGILKGLMQMPMEIFTEISHNLTPGDLIALSWSSKFFRNMLLQRSTIKIWQRAEGNMPGLPPCPVEMSEPQYAALVFAKYCTLCGASATGKPYAHLHVRLCASCRKVELQEVIPWMRRRFVEKGLVNESNCTNVKAEGYRSSGSKACFNLKREFDEVLAKQDEFTDAGDTAGLAEWETNKRKLVKARREHGDELHKYLESSQKSRDGELYSIRRQRKDAINKRLKALGWTDEDLEFGFGDRKQWYALVEVSKPLTDRIWNNIRPKLIPLLEDNRDKQSAHNKKMERIARLRCIHDCVEATRQLTHPLEPIVTALKVDLPPSPELDRFDIRGLGGPIELRDYRLKYYGPNTRLALTWDCLDGLGEREITIEEMKSELEARKDQIEQEVLEWRAGVERRLAEKFQGVAGPADEDVALVVKGDTELTKDIPRNLRLLLRADTVFKYKTPQSGTSARQESDRENSSHYYPSLITRLYDSFNEYRWKPEATDSHINCDIDLNEYQRDADVEKILKLLLADLGMPDVTRLELQVMQARFVCGRCIDKVPKTWDQVVNHYIKAPQTWESIKDNKSSHSVRYPIEYQNVHDLESANNSKPLVRLLTKEEAQAMHDFSYLTNDWSRCYLCRITGRTIPRLNVEDMTSHQLDIHRIDNPLEGIHYGKMESLWFADEWTKIWDAFHDSHNPTSSSS